MYLLLVASLLFILQPLMHNPVPLLHVYLELYLLRRPVAKSHTWLLCALQ